MGRIIAIVNQKGGVGKSTTAQALAAGFILKGKKALIIDLDGQGNTTFTYGADKGGRTVIDLLRDGADAAASIQTTPSGDIIPANNKLFGADSFITGKDREYRLKNALEPLKEKYDYIIIDTPPALGILTVNALTAADNIVITAKADIYSLQGIEELTGTLQPVKEYCNPQLTITGILLTQYSPRSIYSRDITAAASNMAAKLGTFLYSAKIREAVTIREAQTVRQPIYKYAPRANVTADYIAFINELTAHLKKQKGGNK